MAELKQKSLIDKTIMFLIRFVNRFVIPYRMHDCSAQKEIAQPQYCLKLTFRSSLKHYRQQVSTIMVFSKESQGYNWISELLITLNHKAGCS